MLSNLRTLVLVLLASVATAAHAQPQWRFHLAFEDGTGAKDTLWFIYDETATEGWDTNPQVDEHLGEGAVEMDLETFNVWVPNWALDSTKTKAWPYEWFPMGEMFNIRTINCEPPLVMSWDMALFDSPLLPSTPNYLINRARLVSSYFYFTGEGTEMDAFSMFAADHVVVSNPALFFSNLSVVWGYSTLLSVAEEQGQRLQVHPNPTTGPVNVRGFAGRPNRLEVLDIAGRQVASLVFTDRTEADLELAPGVYTYRIMDLSRVATGMAQGHLVIAR